MQSFPNFYVSPDPVSIIVVRILSLVHVLFYLHKLKNLIGSRSSTLADFFMNLEVSVATEFFLRITQLKQHQFEVTRISFLILLIYAVTWCIIIDLKTLC